LSQPRLSAVTEPTPWYRPPGSSQSYFQRGGNCDLLLEMTADPQGSLVCSWSSSASVSVFSLHPQLYSFPFHISQFYSYSTMCSPVLQLSVRSEPPNQHCYGDCIEFGN